MEKWEKRLTANPYLQDKEKEMFRQFADAMGKKRNPAGPRRTEKYLSDLITCRRITGKDWAAMVRDFESLSGVVDAINKSRAHEYRTKKDLKQILGQFYHYHQAKEAGLRYAPKQLKELVAHDAKASDKRLAKAIITREEIRGMLRYADTMDKAILFLLFETGARVGEFEQLAKQDITQIAEGLEVRIPPGKTGERKVVVVEAKKYVNEWLDAHPNLAKDAPLWAVRRAGGGLKGPAIAKRIRILVAKMNEERKRTGIPQFEKSINPHNFRHSRATELGGEPGMTEQLLCKYFGWEFGSDMPKTYLHLTDDQLKRAVLNTYGRAKKEPERKIETHWVCRKCSQSSPLAANYCATCGQPKNSENEITRIGELEARLAEVEAILRRQTGDRVIRDVIKARGGR